MSPEPDEPQLNSVSQANQEEEPHSTDGPGKKVGTDRIASFFYFYGYTLNRTS